MPSNSSSMSGSNGLAHHSQVMSAGSALRHATVTADPSAQKAQVNGTRVASRLSFPLHASVNSHTSASLAARKGSCVERALSARQRV